MSELPVQVPGTVLTMRRVGAYHTLTLAAPGVAERFRPGQYVSLGVGGEHSAMLTRRCFFVREVKADYGGTVEIVFTERGPGTRWLAGLRPRDTVDVAGPLGRPFPLPRDPVICVLVGEAHHSAVLFPLAAVLRERDCQVHFVLGGTTTDDVYGARSARRTGTSSTVATADGSLGTRGGVADLLGDLIEDVRAEVVYAGGPADTLRAISRVTVGCGIPAQVAIEEPMPCGTGVCGACVLPVVADDGLTHMVRSCVDGPVFRGERVRWGDLGTIPFDAQGAPRTITMGER